MKLLAAIGYYDQQGITPNTDYSRFTVRLNSDMQFTRRFSAKLDLYLKYNTQKTPGRGIYDVIYWINRTPSIYPDVLSNGKYAVGWDGDNVLALPKTEDSLNKNALSLHQYGFKLPVYRFSESRC